MPPHSETVTKHCWSDPSDRCTSFRVRGPNYLQDKVKIPSKEAPYKTVGLDLIKSEVSCSQFTVCSQFPACQLSVLFGTIRVVDD